MVKREVYLEQLFSWKDEQVIKVVTGIHRCGKSTLLKQYQAELTAQGVSQEQIVSVNILRNTFQQYDISNFANAAILFFAALPLFNISNNYRKRTQISILLVLTHICFLVIWQHC